MSTQPATQQAQQRSAAGRFDASIALPREQRLLLHPSAFVAGPTRIQADAQTLGKFVYSAQFYGNDLKIYHQQGLNLQFVTEITNHVVGPQGTMTTPSGWWYVANSLGSNVLIYKTKKKGPSGLMGTLNDPNEVPGNVAVTSSRRLIAVSNVSDISNGPGSVSVYLARSPYPDHVLTFGNVRGEGIAIDHQGDCFWSVNPPSGGGEIIQFAKCAGNGTVLQTPAIGFAGGLVFMNGNDLLYLDQTQGIFKCKGTKSCVPFSTSGFGDPVNMNFEAKQKHLWVADATGFLDAVDPRSGAIVLTYPAQGGPSDPPIGIAPAPGSK